MTNVNWIPLTSSRVAALDDGRPGAYLLSRDDNTVHYVGRSDVDIKARLRTYIGGKYTEFGYCYVPTAEAAYEQESRWYHEFNPADNSIHPDATMSTWRCPQAGCPFSGMFIR